jgi:lysophospholipase L1-like esterase
MTRLSRPLLALTVLVLALAVVELASRVLVAARTPEGMTFDRELVYDLAPHSRPWGVQLNALGCIGDDLEPADPGSLDVLLLGGSTSYSAAYVDAVRTRLRAVVPDARVRVMSCGRPRYTSHLDAVLFDRLAERLRPTAVVLYLGINDTIYDTFPWLGPVPEVGIFDWRDPRRSIFLGLLRYYVVDKELRACPGFGLDDLRSPQILRQSVERVIATARRIGATPVLSSFALALPSDDPVLADRIARLEPRMEHFWGRVASTRLAVAVHNRVIAEIAAREGLSLAQVDGAIPRDHEHFGDICHLTPAGNGILGRVVADAVAAASPLSRSPRTRARSRGGDQTPISRGGGRPPVRQSRRAEHVDLRVLVPTTTGPDRAPNRVRSRSADTNGVAREPHARKRSTAAERVATTPWRYWPPPPPGATIRGTNPAREGRRSVPRERVRVANPVDMVRPPA